MRTVVSIFRFTGSLQESGIFRLQRVQAAVINESDLNKPWTAILRIHLQGQSVRCHLLDKP